MRVAAFIGRFRWFIAAGGALVIALVLFLAFRDHGITLAVPKAELAAYQKILSAWKRPSNAPTVRLRAYEAEGPVLLERGRPTFMVVSLAPWVTAAEADGRLAPLPGGAFGWDASKYPAAFTAAAGAGARAGITASAGAAVSAPTALPIAFDPWLAAWHRDLIGGGRAAPPADWAAVAKMLKTWKKTGAAAFAVPGKEGDAALGWLAVLAQSREGAGFQGLSGLGGDSLSSAFSSLGGFQADGIFQKSSFSYVWKDAVDLVLQKKAAAMFMPISRFRALNPVSSAPLIVSRLPDFPGERGSAILADVRVLVMPARTARAKGRDVLTAWLADPVTQRALADALGIVPARLDSAVRDGASYAAVDAARHAGALILPPLLTLSAARAADFTSSVGAVLRSPKEASSITADLLSR